MKKTFLAVALGLFAYTGFAQKSHGVSIVIPTVMDFSLQNGDLNFNYSENNLKNNTNPNAKEKELKVRSNKDWKITVYADGAFVSADEANDTEIPISVLAVSVGGNAAIGTLSTDSQSPSDLVSGSKGGYGNHTYSLSYSVDLDDTEQWSYTPDTYSTKLTYTISED